MRVRGTYYHSLLEIDTVWSGHHSEGRPPLCRSPWLVYRTMCRR